MGEIKRQSIQNSVIQYIGIALGYFNSVFLFTAFLDTEQYGLTRVLFAIAGVYVNLSSLGTFKLLVRFFPFFQTGDGRHQGFLTFGFVFSFIGFLLATILYAGLESPIVRHFQDTSKLFTDHYYIVVLLSFIMLYTNVLEHFLMAMRLTVMTYFLKNIFIRLVWIAEILAYHFNWMNFETFLYLYVASYSVNFLVMFIYLVYMGEMGFSMEFFKLRRRIFKVVINYSLFSIMSGISTILVNRIDVIMISFLLGLSSTSVYSIAYYISSVILVPSQAIARISAPVIASQWKRKKLDDMKLIYRKSSINQFLSGGFVFMCIWVNIDALFGILRNPEYSDGKWVVFILSMATMFNMVTGINHLIINITKYYRYDTYASLALGLLTIVTNLIFIPLYGIEGAAFATLLSVVAYHGFKYSLIRIKLKMQPFSRDTLLTLIFMLAVYYLTSLVPEMGLSVLLYSLLKCMLIAFLFLMFLLFTRVSPDIRDEIKKYLYLGKIFRS